MGAWFLGVTLVASIAWFGWHWHEYHEYSLARAGVRVLISAFAGAILGKLVGIGFYHLRRRKLRNVFSATG